MRTCHPREITLHVAVHLVIDLATRKKNEGDSRERLEDNPMNLIFSLIHPIRTVHVRNVRHQDGIANRLFAKSPRRRTQRLKREDENVNCARAAAASPHPNPKSQTLDWTLSISWMSPASMALDVSLACAQPPDLYTDKYSFPPRWSIRCVPSPQES